MAEPIVSTPCSRCGAEVLQEDLVQGLAVRLDGTNVCPACIDGLSGAAQVAINRLRALRGLPTTTFRVVLPRFPRTETFTFTTAGNQLVHRRQLLRGEEFHAPQLPQVAKPVAAAPVAASASVGKLMLGLCAGVVVAGAVSIGGLMWWQQRTPAPAPVIPSPSQPAPVRSVPTAPEPPPEDTPAVAIPLRSDFPADPLLAYAAAEVNAAVPVVLFERIRAEALAVTARQLVAIASDVAAGRRERAGRALVALALPQDPAFAELRAEYTRLVTLQQALPQALVPAVAQEAVPVSPTPVMATPTPVPDNDSPATADVPSGPVLGQIFPPAPTRLALDGTVSIPSPWPSSVIPGKDPLPIEPIFLGTIKREVEIELPAGPAGGVLVQVNTTVGLRAAIAGTEAGQFSKPDGQRTWAWWSISLPERLAPARLRLRTEGNGGFVLGPVIQVAGAEPATTLIHTTPPPLRLIDPGDAGANRTLSGVLRLINEGRRNPTPPLDPTAVKVLFGDDLAQGLGTDLNRRLTGSREDAPRKQVEDLADFSVGWLERLQFKAKAALAPADRFSLLVLWPGIQAAKLAEGGQLAAIRKAMLDPERATWRDRAYLLPVVVVGTAVAVNDAQRAALDAAYAALITQADQLGLPVIDVRAASGRTKSALRDDAARLLADGLANLAWHLRALGSRR